MRMVHQSGAHLNLDSINQLNIWKRLFGDAPVGIRCNIGQLVDAQATHAGYFIGKESRLGFSGDEIRSLQGDRGIRGLHIYVGTDIQNIDYFMACYRALGTLLPYFPNLEYLNFGGGFGIDESGRDAFPMTAYSRRVSQLMQELSQKAGRPLRLVLEPGRIIGGKAGHFVCRVTDVKERSDRTFIGVNASSVQFPRPLFYPDTARHPVAIIQEGRQLRSVSDQSTSIYGCSTYSRDFLLRDARLPEAQIGDLLILGNAGSYCTSAFTDFLGFSRPKEYFL
jgi:diaminopimelate decarboxylase